jgi:phosphoribosylamine-glycine ligase
MAKNYPVADRIDAVPVRGVSRDRVDTGLNWPGGGFLGEGLARRGDEFMVAGGRVIAAAARGPDLEVLRRQVYGLLSGVSFEGAHWRTDLGVGVQALTAPAAAPGTWLGERV